MVLKSEMMSAFTSVSNLFIEEYMPEANGEYVKVYLLLLRLQEQEISAELLADILECSEKDILRALRYWEKQGLLKLRVNDKDELEEMSLLALRRGGSGKELHLGKTAGNVSEGLKEDGGEPVQTPARQEEAGEKLLSASPEPSVSVPDGNVPRKDASEGKGRRSFRPSEVSAISSSHSDFHDLLFTAEAYMERPLTQRETETFAYLYQELQLPADELEYLVEYAVQNHHKDIRYMEKTALNWHRDGIVTRAQAMAQTDELKEENRAVMRAFGISGRVLNPDEREQIAFWKQKLKMPTELIEEACRRTIKRIHQTSFSYAESMLKDWSKAKADTLEKVNALPRENGRSASGAKSFENRRRTDYDALFAGGTRDDDE